MKYFAPVVAALAAQITVTMATTTQGTCLDNGKCGGTDASGNSWEIGCWTGTCDCPDPTTLSCTYNDLHPDGAECHNHGDDGCAAS